MQTPDTMTATTNAMHYEPACLMFVSLGFEIAEVHRFVSQEMMYGPKNILRLCDKRVKQLLTVDCKPGEGVVSVPVDKL